MRRFSPGRGGAINADDNFGTLLNTLDLEILWFSAKTAAVQRQHSPQAKAFVADILSCYLDLTEQHHEGHDLGVKEIFFC